MRRAALLVALILFPTCQVPADPDGTLERVRGGTLRVGISAHDPWTTLPPAGIEPTLVARFARQQRARVEWRQGTEAELIEALEVGELDLVVAGLTADTPWRTHAALTRPYLRVGGEAHVLAAPLGENAFLVTLERFLADREGEARRLLEQGGAPA